MEEKQAQGAHKVTITGRRSGTISGVVDVLSFDVNEVVLETEMGMMMVKGSELHINRLNLEKGEVDLDGSIDSLTYSDGKAGRRQGESFIGRLFK